jgi:hypothetical protein
MAEFTFARRSPEQNHLTLLGRHAVQVHHFKSETDDPLY